LSARIGEYDDFGRVIEVNTSTKNGAVSMTYDARGNLLQRKGGSATVAYSYDGLDHLLTASATNSADSTVISYTYRHDEGGAAGQLTSVIGPSRTLLYEYAPGGRLVRERVRENGVTAELVTTYARDLDGDVTRIDYPSGLSVVYELDPATKRATRVYDAATGGAYASAVEWWPGGPMRAMSFGNGYGFSAVYDARYLPESLTSGPLVLDFDLTPAGNVAGITQGATPRPFVHDG
jgi:YD repeat-containing protein